MHPTLSFKHRIVLLVAFAVLAVLALAVNSVISASGHIREGRQQTLVAAVESAYSIVLGFHAQAQAGALSTEQAQAAAVAALRAARYGDGDYFYIWTRQGVNVLLPPRPEWEGTNRLGQVPDGQGGDVIRSLVHAVNTPATGGFADTRFPRPGQSEPAPKLQFVKLVPDWDWMVGSGLYTDDLDAAIQRTALNALLVCAVVLLALGAVATVVVRSVQRQLGGDPALAARVASEVAQGHLDVHIPPAPAGSLLADLAAMVAALRQTVSRVHQSTESVNVAASEIATGNADLSARTEQAAANLQRTASAMEQLTATVQHTADSARTATQLAGSAADVAQRGGQVVTEVVQTMDGINRASERMADIIGAIDGIAFQTNILALNAAVEAARAGEQGRGFAVVASEVRNLAGRSAEAAKEIKQLISASREQAAAGAKLVGHAGQTMQEIVASVHRVTDIVGEISNATHEQSQGIVSINGAVTELEEMTQRNAALVEESAAAAQSLREQSDLLSGAVSSFRCGQQHPA